MNDVVYLYGFVPDGTPAPPASLTGLAGAPVELVPIGGVQAAIARLPAGEWCADRLETRLADLQWVGEQGLAHERVVLWFVDHADILPARLFSLHSNEAALRAAVEPTAAAMAERLRRLGGRREWNLKVAVDATELGRHGGVVSDELRRLDDELATAPPGRRYLLQRQRSDILKREISRAAKRLAGELLEALAAHAEAVQVLPLADAGAAGNVVLNAALLVTRSAEADLRADADRRISALSPLGVMANLTGPWAPYRFLEADAEA